MSPAPVNPPPSWRSRPASGRLRRLFQLWAAGAVALQQAQLALLRAPGTAHPYYWAPFLLLGAR